MKPPLLTVIDNYDSFTFNLVQMFLQYPLAVNIYRSDEISAAAVAVEKPDYVLISPGPKDPAHAGISRSLIGKLYKTVPILGVCLGMQCISEVFGGQTKRAPVPVHGKTSEVWHDGEGLFETVPSPFRAARYHSLMATGQNNALQVTGRTKDGVVMGLSHRQYPLHGVQFHPESFMTEHGYLITDNFLKTGPLKNPKPSADGPGIILKGAIR